jgi:hypothetical protein
MAVPGYVDLTTLFHATVHSCTLSKVVFHKSPDLALASQFDARNCTSRLPDAKPGRSGVVELRDPGVTQNAAGKPGTNSPRPSAPIQIQIPSERTEYRTESLEILNYQGVHVRLS